MIYFLIITNRLDILQPEFAEIDSESPSIKFFPTSTAAHLS